ncbi:hypothetical protein E2C01_079192 [Portunus trituberculatus]|uniref:Uncharacterized protein n=1 Tax=Portunus trituberculatus TaxID=210409 RepID=A0A5B7IW81_PORTR|nr:hypothetical protein [Portunus trituberculatus]
MSETNPRLAHARATARRHHHAAAAAAAAAVRHGAAAGRRGQGAARGNVNHTHRHKRGTLQKLNSTEGVAIPDPWRGGAGHSGQHNNQSGAICQPGRPPRRGAPSPAAPRAGRIRSAWVGAGRGRRVPVRVA